MHIAGFSGAATAQTLDQQRCAAPDPDVAILSCTAIIQSGHETQQNLANTYTRRGTLHARKGQYDRAFEDFDEAEAIRMRLLAQHQSPFAGSAGGDADVAEAKQLNPNVAPALADSKSSAETTCLAAIDGLAKVAVIAQENNWATSTGQGVACSVRFPGKNVKREEFFNLISASVDLTFMSDMRLPQQRDETYEIKSDRTNKLVLYIMSQSDGTLITARVSEMPRFAPRQVASPEVDRTPALADSKSSAEFTLTTCLAAMDDLAKVEVMARENNWTNKTPPISAAMSKIANSLSTWEVTQGDDKFTVTIWVDVSGPPLNVCAVHFPGKVKREDFLNLISASVELTFMSDTRFPQRRSETYEIKRNRSDRTNKLMLYIMSQSDGTLMNAMVSEVFARQIAPGDR